MKRISFFLAFVLTLCAFGIANAQTAQISLEQALDDGVAITNDTIFVGAAASNLEFQLRVTYDNGAESIVGTSCGFALLGSVPGVQWNSTSASYLPGWPSAGFDFLNQSVVYSGDGDGADTATFENARLFGDGTNGALDAVAWSIQADGFMPGITDGSFDGEQLCLDSVPNYGPSNLNWLWNQSGTPVEVVPEWLGPYCFTIFFLPNQPPTIDNCPGAQASVLHCDAYSVDLDASDPEGDPFTFEIVSGPAGASVDPNTGVVTYNPDFADIGLQTIEVAANDGQQGPVCAIEVNVTNDAPVVTNCPANNIGVQTGVERTLDLDADDTCPGDAQNWSILDDGGTAGTVTVDASGVVSFTPDAADDGLEICVVVEVSDGDAASTCEICFDVSAGAPYGIVIEKDEGQTGSGALQGQYTEVDVTMTAASGPLGGFNLLFAYDASALSFAAPVVARPVSSVSWVLPTRTTVRTTRFWTAIRPA